MWVRGSVSRSTGELSREREGSPLCGSVSRSTGELSREREGSPLCGSVSRSTGELSREREGSSSSSSLSEKGSSSDGRFRALEAALLLTLRTK